MPLLPGLLRRRAPSGEDLRRRTFYHTETAPGNLDNALNNDQTIEQLPRSASAIGFAPTSDGVTPSSAERQSSDVDVQALGRSVSPLPIQEESSKHRRFSMLKFRHASESHLSRKAREHAIAPPIPQRTMVFSLDYLTI